MPSSKEERPMYDAIVIGAGPAGLSGALILARCRRRVLVFDSGRYRNYAVGAMHGFLSRDGVPPAELRRIGREQLQPYGVEIRETTVTGARRSGNHFELTVADGERVTCRKLLLATGLVDQLPEVPGVGEMYGKSVHHCPYCDGWECRDQPIGIYARECSGIEMSLRLRTWTNDIILFTDGPAGISAEDAARLERNGIRVREEKIARLEGTNGMLERIAFVNGGGVERSALFLKTRQEQGSSIAKQLRCAVTAEHGVETAGKHEETHTKGVFVAGDSSKDVLLAIMAAAEGADAAFGINCELQEEDIL